MMTISQNLLDILACPQCKGQVNYRQDAQEICCDACSLAFPVRDNIPVMIIDEARSLGKVPDGMSEKA